MVEEAYNQCMDYGQGTAKVVHSCFQQDEAIFEAIQARKCFWKDESMAKEFQM